MKCLRYYFSLILQFVHIAVFFMLFNGFVNSNVVTKTFLKDNRSLVHDVSLNGWFLLCIADYC